MSFGVVVTCEDDVEIARQSTTDFVEVKGDLLVSDRGRRAMRSYAAVVGSRVAALTSPLPRQFGVRVVGPTSDHITALRICRHILREAADLGVRVVTVGCSQARAYPHGYSPDVAAREFAEFVRRLQVEASALDMLIGVEPLIEAETNLLNDVPEALRWVTGTEIGLVYDLFHGIRSGRSATEDLGALKGRLVHVQLADPVHRGLPCSEQHTRELVRALVQMRYAGLVSIETPAPLPGVAEVNASLAFLRREWQLWHS